MKARRNLFAALGWFVWKLLALVGLPIARRKIEQRREQRSGNAVTRGVRSAVRRRR